jgi:hypothetical protein
LSLTICDPACGSGAFLNAALDFLIAEHKLIDEMYAKIHNVPIVFSDIENAILENNLYGVDINEESVEIAKLALWLRTAKPNRKLNSLNENIKCGNSLISDPEVAGDKAFDWHKAFPQVFRKGGFDVVIGNPPWGARINETEKKVLSADFSFIGGKNSDTYMYFIFKIIDILKVEGFMGVIIPNTWMLINSGVDIRRKILNYDIKEIIDYGDGVFEDATVESMTIVLKKALSDNELVIKRQKGNLELSCNIIKKEIWEKHSDCRILVDLTNDISILIDKIHLNTKCFSEIGEIIWGIKPYQVGHGYPRQTKEMQNERVYHSKTKYNEKWKPLVVGSNVDRYVFDKEKVEYILYGKNLMYMSNEDKIKQPKLLMRQTSDILRVCYDDESYYPQNSIFIITSLNDNVINLKYLMLLLNSTLFRLIYKIQNPQTGKIFAEIKPSIIKKLPIKHISLPHQQPFIIKAGQMLSLNAEWQTRRQRFLRRLTGNLTVTRGHAPLLDATDFKHFLSELKKQKITLSLKQQDEWEEYFNNYKSECNNLSTQIAETDKTIDRMVYELYGLTEEEIDMIENRN